MGASTHIYLVQSPLQVINAFEARRSCGANEDVDHKLILFERKEAENNRLLRNTLACLNWQPIYSVPYSPSNVGKCLHWLRLRLFLASQPRVKRIFIGEYASGMPIAAANLFPKAETYLLDDGTSSLNFPDFRYHGKKTEHLPGAKNIPSLGYYTNLPEGIRFFSIYDLPLKAPDILIRNELSFLRDSFQADPNGPVYFIGSCLPDVEVITFDAYFDLMRGVRKWFGSRDIYYFPHRREILPRKEALFRELGINLQSTDLPFELHVTRTSLRPSYFATFYSTAFDTLKLIGAGNSNKLIAFHVPSELIQTAADRSIAEMSYSNYTASGQIEVIREFVNFTQISSLE